jgi:RNA polymerase sigma factor (sigma-70 family)
MVKQSSELKFPYTRLTLKQELELGKLKDEGTPEQRVKAKDSLAKNYIQMVYASARKFSYLNPEIPLEDFFSEGQSHLLQIIEAYDYKKGNKFSTFLNKALYNRYINLVKQTRKTNKNAFDYSLEILSNGALCVFPEENENTQDILSSVFQPLIKKLSPIEQAVLYSRFFCSETLKEAGKKIKKSKQGAANIEKRALERLRCFLSPNQIENLRNYL